MCDEAPAHRAPTGARDRSDALVKDGGRVTLATLSSFSGRPDVRAAYNQMTLRVGFDLVIPGTFNPNGGSICLCTA